jgi:hypothetical protein
VTVFFLLPSLWPNLKTKGGNHHDNGEKRINMDCGFVSFNVTGFIPSALEGRNADPISPVVMGMSPLHLRPSRHQIAKDATAQSAFPPPPQRWLITRLDAPPLADPPHVIWR